MTEQQMWEAVQTNDAHCDGVFFYAVKTTGIFCRPSCPSKTPKRENVCFFETAKQAEQAGFRPCKRCRSDLAAYQPQRALAQEVKARIDASFAAQTELQQSLRAVGVTARRLSDIFKLEFGMTPKDYADSLRLREALRLLTASDQTVLDVALDTGFDNLSAFYRFFKRHMGQTPTDYRKAARK